MVSSILADKRWCGGYERRKLLNLYAKMGQSTRKVKREKLVGDVGGNWVMAGAERRQKHVAGNDEDRSSKSGLGSRRLTEFSPPHFASRDYHSAESDFA